MNLERNLAKPEQESAQINFDTETIANITDRFPDVRAMLDMILPLTVHEGGVQSEIHALSKERKESLLAEYNFFRQFFLKLSAMNLEDVSEKDTFQGKQLKALKTSLRGLINEIAEVLEVESADEMDPLPLQ